eukprot:jgi/Botrbrau1/18743/Bobra.0386s0066.1
MTVPVILRVYDLAPTHNSWTYWCGVGIFHSGVEVHGVEYAYGGHEYDVSGIFATPPGKAPGDVVYREHIVLGQTDFTAHEVQEIILDMGRKYRGNSYHLLQQNCNHFSDELCLRLTGQHAPFWINRLAGLAVMLHCLLPSAWVPPLSTPSVGPLFGSGESDDEFDHETQGLIRRDVTVLRRQLPA